MAATLLALLALAGPVVWTVEPDRPTIDVSPDLYGIFFEEINWAGDGGLYAELIRNRKFDDAETLEHWRTTAGRSSLVKEGSGKFLRLEANGGPGAVANEGWGGMGLRQGKTYRLDLRVRGSGNLDASLGDDSAPVRVGLEAGWKDVRLTLKAKRTNAAGVLKLATDGQLDLAWASLFPTDTFRGRENGMRKDLAQILQRLQPAFFRFPGGCWVEGYNRETAYRWKQTVGDLKTRKTVHNLWGYHSPNGLGYHEYLQLCEDLKTDPLFVVNVGMWHGGAEPLGGMAEFVQDAVDAVEYANGPVDSKWGAMRAKNGHPKPFGLKYVEIGNENGGPAYDVRYALMYNALKQRFPEVQLIACLWGGSPTSAPVDILDEHYYNNPEWFFQNHGRYDGYDRKGPKIYVGEYAVTQGVGEGNLRGALAEAAFMMGMERNSDIVKMSSYAPLFAHPTGKRWNPDLIYFDALRTAETPSYHVQRMFSTNRPDRIVRSALSETPTHQRQFGTGGIAVGTWNTQAEFKDIRVERDGQVLFADADGSKMAPGEGEWQVVDGALRQKSTAEPSFASAGSADWDRYTLTLKARKLSGAEGFLVSVGRKDARHWVWVNLGGWGNQQHGLELSDGGSKSNFGRQPRGRIEEGRWYDVKVDFAQDRVRAYLDGRPVLEEGVPAVPTLFGVAGKRGSETILKVVNSANEPQTVTIDLRGGRGYELSGEVLTGPMATAGNTLDSPKVVRPTAIRRETVAAKFDRRLPANSLTVLRLRAR